MGCCSCCAKCCLCTILLQVIAIGIIIALIPAYYLSYENYWKPWGEQQLKNAPPLPSIPDISCGECFGINAEYPIDLKHTNYTKFQVYLMNEGGKYLSSFTSISVAVGGSAMVFSTVTAIAASMAVSSTSSFSLSSTRHGGLFEMVLMINQAQFITMLGSLQLDGVPVFFLEFCKQLAWTNLMIFPSKSTTTSQPRLLLASGGDSSVNGVQRYAHMLGVNPDNLFYYTVLALLAVCAIIVGLYFLARIVLTKCWKPDDIELARMLDNRVVWVTIQLLLLMQYAISMTSCFQIYYAVTTHGATGGLVLAIFVLLCSCVGVLVFGVVKISQHKHELEDLGKATHEKKPFNHKYGAYYQDFTKENRYFFVAKVGLDIASGAVVGTVQNVMHQIAWLVGLNALFLVLLIVRRPYLIPLFYKVGVISGYLRVILLLLTVIQAQPNIFPQHVRDLVAVIIIGVNGILFLCLLIRQVYVICLAVYKWCTNKNKPSDDDENEYDDLDFDGIPLQERPPRPQLDEFNDIESNDLQEMPDTPPIDATPPSTHAYQRGSAKWARV